MRVYNIRLERNLFKSIAAHLCEMQMLRSYRGLCTIAEYVEHSDVT